MSLDLEDTEFIKVEVRSEGDAVSDLVNLHQDEPRILNPLDLVNPGKPLQQPLKKMVTLTCRLCTQPILLKNKPRTFTSTVKEKLQEIYKLDVENDPPNCSKKICNTCFYHLKVKNLERLPAVVPRTGKQSEEVQVNFGSKQIEFICCRICRKSPRKTDKYYSLNSVKIQLKEIYNFDADREPSSILCRECYNSLEKKDLRLLPKILPNLLP